MRKALKLRSMVLGVLALILIVLRLFGLPRDIYYPLAFALTLAVVFDYFFYRYRVRRKAEHS